MPTTITHGIDLFTSGDYLDEVKVSAATEVSERRGTTGDIKKVKDFNPTNEVSIKGGGSSGLSVGVATLSVTGLTGGAMMLTKDEHTQKNSDFDDFQSDVKHYPNASSS